MNRPPNSIVVRRSKRERVFVRVGLMVFGRESATVVPRRQRRNLGLYLKVARTPWARGRARRGFATTGLGLLLLLAMPQRAQAQATARFADLPTSSSPAKRAAASHAAPAPTSAPAATSAPAVESKSSPPRAASPPTAAAEGFSRRLARSHLERAESLEARGELARALSEYTRALNVDSTLGEAYLRLGALRERTGDPREAEHVYSAAIQLTDMRAEALIQRARLRRIAGLSADALADLEAAARLAATPALLQELARGYIEKRAWSAALASYRRLAAMALTDGNTTALDEARLQVRALRVLAAETDPTQERGAKHDWVRLALRSIARRGR